MKLYILDVAMLEDPRDRIDWKEKMVDGRWERIVRYPSLEDRQTGAGAGLLLRYAFEREGIPFCGDSFYVGAHGKPYHNKLCFNISHSGRYVICVTGKEDVGCDIQKIKPAHPRIMNSFFTDSEREYVQFADDSMKEECFTRIWALKESYLKMTGDGLTRNLQDISFEIGDRIRLFENQKERFLYFTEHQIKNYIIMVCGKEQEMAVEHVKCHAIDNCF